MGLGRFEGLMSVESEGVGIHVSGLALWALRERMATLGGLWGVEDPI